MSFPPLTAADLPDLNKGPGHKYTHGHALVLSGPPGKGGAARLAARAALRIGAGLVTVGCPQRAVFEHSAQLNAVMVEGLDGAFGLSEFLEDPRVTAICLGPGLGLTGTTGEMVRRSLEAKRGTVLDADALSRFQRSPDALFDMLHPDCVLTPHQGEFTRLFPDIAEGLDGEDVPRKAAAVQAAAARAGCTVLLKGVETLIATPAGTTARHSATGARSAPWLATAGAGDVLAGIITGLLARGVAPFEAASAGAFVHVQAALTVGPGLIAEDLPDALPAVLRALLTQATGY